MSKDEILNKQMELLQVSNEELHKIYDSITTLQQKQKEHAELLRELAGLLGLSEEEERRIVTL